MIQIFFRLIVGQDRLSPVPDGKLLLWFDHQSTGYI